MKESLREVKIGIVVRKNGKLSVRSNVKGTLVWVYDENEDGKYPMHDKLRYKAYRDE